MADGAGEESLSRRGIVAMDPEQGIEALQRAAGPAGRLRRVADVDWAEFAPRTMALRPGQLFDTVPEAQRALEGKPAAAEPLDRADGLRQRIAGLPEGERTRALVELVRREAAPVLRHDTTDAVRPDGAFKEPASTR